MPQFQRLSNEDREIGKALAERAKLDPSIVLEDYDVQSHGDTVTIRFEAIHQMPRAEFEALYASVKAGASKSGIPNDLVGCATGEIVTPFGRGRLEIINPDTGYIQGLPAQRPRGDVK